MDNIDHVIETFKIYLLSTPYAKPYKMGTEIAIRCPFCGDSGRTKTPHMYVSLQRNNSYNLPLFPYQCKRAVCGKSSAVLTKEVALMLGVNDYNILSYLDEMTAKMKNSVRHISKFSPNKKLIIDRYDDIDISNELIMNKLMYVGNRIGYKDIVDNYRVFKIIPDLIEFFKVNHLQPNFEYSDVRNLLRLLHNSSVGFLSADNTKINFRDINHNGVISLKDRYFQYSLYPSTVTSSGLYFIPNVINILKNNTNLVMAEGSFDILRIFVDFYKMDYNHGLFAAVNNAGGYKPCINKVLSMGIMPKKITIYSDDDVDLNYYKYKVKPKVPTIPLEIFYNELSKDYGNVQDPIKLIKRTL